MREKEVLEKMLQVEQNACHVVEEAKEEANKLLAHARNKARCAIDSTKGAICQDREKLREHLNKEAEEKVKIINEEKKHTEGKIKMRAHLKREEAIKKAKKYLFDDFLESL